jgi:hypothetical protein
VTLTTLICCVNKGNILFSIKPLLLSVLLIILILFSGFRGHQVDADSANYIDWFRSISEDDFVNIFNLKDPAFYLVAHLSVSLGFGVSFLFLFYAAVSLWLKFHIVKHFPGFKYSHFYVYLYFCRFYFVHDMTQIRTGVAVGFISLALLLCREKKYIFSFLMFLSAISFHLSAFLMAPFFLVIALGYRFEFRFPIVLFVCLSIFLAFKTNLILNFWVLDDMARLNVYLNDEYSVQKISLLSVYFLAKCIIIGWLFFFRWENLDYLERLVFFLVVAGLSLQVALMDIDALALRAAEVFSIFDLFLFLIPLNFLKKLSRFFYAIFLLLLGGLFFTSSLKIIMPYHSIF